MFRSTLIVSILAALGTGVSFLNQLILARIFGTSAQMDAYLMAISLPLTISSLLAGVLNYQLVPALRHSETTTGGADSLMRSLAWGLGGGAAILSLIGSAAAIWEMRIMNSGLSAAQLALIVKLAHITWLCLPLAVLGTIFTAGLHIRQRFAAATLIAALPMAASIVICVLFHSAIGIEAPVWGQFLGYLAMPVGLRLALGKSRPGQDWTGTWKLLGQAPLALISVLLFVIYPFSDAIWGSRIGLSAVSYLGYAQRLLVGFSGLAVVGATTVLFPHLARQAAEGEHQALRRDLGFSLRTMLVCMAPAAAIIGVLSVPAVQVLFQRGAFRLSDARALGGLLRPMLAGMVAMSCMGLVFKGLFARGQVRAAAVLSLTGSFVYFALSGLLGSWLGLLGVGYAYAVSWWLVLFMGLKYLWREVPFWRLLGSGLGFAVRLGAAAALVAVVAWIGALLLPVNSVAGFPRRVLVLIGTGTVALCSYIAFGNGPVALPEVRLLTRQAVKLARRS